LAPRLHPDASPAAHKPGLERTALTACWGCTGTNLVCQVNEISRKISRNDCETACGTKRKRLTYWQTIARVGR
jgi:hypothetical protein